MDPKSTAILADADRNSAVVHLHFVDGTAVEARIREVDWERHRCVTYMDMDAACCAVTADLDVIARVTTAGDAERSGAREDP